jgi:flagellar hook protein FlgE
MIRSMFSAISGLRNHQTMMDVVGNNIANVNTAGFKSSNVVFQDILSQSLRGAGLPSGALGGTNPAQVGLGAKITSTTTNFSQGALQRSGRATDMAIQGDGFFIVDQGGAQLFTRAGQFSLDALGQLVTQEGGFVQGWTADNQGIVNSNSAPGTITIPVGATIDPITTTEMSIGGNLPSSAPATTSAIPAQGASLPPQPPILPAGSAVTMSAEIYDDRGTAVPITLTWYKTSAPAVAPSTWEVRASVPDPATPGNARYLSLPTTTFSFDAAGNLVGAPTMNVPRAQLVAAGYPAFTSVPNPDIAFNFGGTGSTERLTGFANLNTASIRDQNGAAEGTLQGFSVGQDGLIQGAFTNGQTQPIGQIALAAFANPEGLEKVGGSNFRSTVNSGVPQVGTAGLGGRGLLSSGGFEMSNVDLAQEFTNLIISQRGFQANSRVVTTSDELLQELVNLKR